MPRSRHQVREIGTRSGRYSCTDCPATFENWEAADAHERETLAASRPGVTTEEYRRMQADKAKYVAPAVTPARRRFYQSMDNEMAARGFEVQETGGGCQAYVRTISENEYEMVTDANDPSLPESFDTPVICGLYLNGESEPANIQQYQSLRALLDGAEHIRRN